MWEHENEPLASSPSLNHLRSRPTSNWALSLALALVLSKSLPLYHHHLGHNLTSLATQHTVPCGLLVTLGLLDETEAPPWETKYDPSEHHLKSLFNFAAAQRARKVDVMMSQEQADIPRMKIQAEEWRKFSEQSRKDKEQAKERGSERQREAVGSSRLDAVSVNNTILEWLRTERLVDENSSVQSAVETLVDLIRKEEHAISVCNVLEPWR